ncbi:FK506-binding protein 2 [Akanthomyces lecanii RCEF 1005]|uniref:peptidylprolyl isomerase n=1 Tax=Akanthomyces lecanii RCEF 1005 TaxID=1081108 RepID=A0A162KZQ8_CORDF|nr:FK506-binding protein 2 [Akanthomyces lecanii RCEF 1005]
MVAALLDDILHLVGDHFREIFSRQLSRRVEINSQNKDCLTIDQKRTALLQAYGLQYAQNLVFKDPEGFADEFQQCTSGLTELVRRLPQLHTVSVQDLNVSHQLMVTLSEVPHLRSLALNFLANVGPNLDDSDASSGSIVGTEVLSSSQATEETAEGTDNDLNASNISDGMTCQVIDLVDGEVNLGEDGPEETDLEDLILIRLPPRFTPVFKLESFRNMNRLSVMNMFGDPNIWSEWLLGILPQSPSLKHLSLSIAEETEHILYHCQKQEALARVFSGLCFEYGERALQPLRLRTLRLGRPFSFPDLPTLSILTELKHLEDIYIFNQNPTHSIPFDVLSPEATPSLRRLFLEVVSNSLLERLDDIFGVPQVRKPTTLGIQSWDNGGIRLAEFRNLLNKTPDLLLPVCMGGFGDLGVVLPRLIHNLVIRQLSISVPESVWDIQFPEGVLFDNFRVILMTMENLEALWVASCAEGRKFSSFSEDGMRHLRAMKTATLLSAIAALAATAAAAAELKIDVTHKVECERKTKKGDKVSMHYRGTLAADGSQFDASASFFSAPFPSRNSAQLMNAVLIGRFDSQATTAVPLSTSKSALGSWDEGLLDMCIGEKRTLTIPPEYGYGDRGIGPIPGGATLIFETELVGIAGVKPPAKADEAAPEGEAKTAKKEEL